MRYLLSDFVAIYSSLVGVKPHQATIKSSSIIDRDYQTGLDLKLCKNYCKVDGESEDDVLQILMQAAQETIEQKHVISLDGRTMEVLINNDGYFDKSILPFHSQIISIDHFRCDSLESALTYTISANKDAGHLREVYALVYEMYSNKHEPKRPKKIYI
jgi:hypothetical protein